MTTATDGYLRSAERRFWKFVAPEPNTGCWLWTGAVFAGIGYGAFSFRGGNVGAHRAAYELFVGPIPDGLFVCHRCDVRLCVNPEHLFLGTNSDNQLDVVRKGRVTRGTQIAARTHCKHGHPFSGENVRLRHRPGKPSYRVCRACERAKYQPGGLSPVAYLPEVTT